MEQAVMSKLTCAVITLSDRASQGIYTDQSTAVACDILTANGHTVCETLLLPDDTDQLVTHLHRLCDQLDVNLILTTGGTGLSPRDITPEATLSLAHRQVPGIGEALRAFSLTITPHAMLSRGVAVIRNQTLIVNLPGSPKAVGEILTYALPSLVHGIGTLLGREDG